MTIEITKDIRKLLETIKIELIRQALKYENSANNKAGNFKFNTNCDHKVLHEATELCHMAKAYRNFGRALNMEKINEWADDHERERVE